ncbi:MAG: hypothetical protein Q9226_006631 [Calogaya cf. arnoldii]
MAYGTPASAGFNIGADWNSKSMKVTPRLEFSFHALYPFTIAKILNGKQGGPKFDSAQDLLFILLTRDYADDNNPFRKWKLLKHEEVETIKNFMWNINLDLPQYRDYGRAFDRDIPNPELWRQEYVHVTRLLTIIEKGLDHHDCKLVVFLLYWTKLTFDHGGEILELVNYSRKHDKRNVRREENFDTESAEDSFRVVNWIYYRGHDDWKATLWYGATPFPEHSRAQPDKIPVRNDLVQSMLEDAGYGKKVK